MRGATAGGEIPTGSVTLLFTDIEGSTRLLQRTGDRYADILGAHHRVLRGAIAAHRGYEVDTAGDGFFVAFSSASDALRCSLAMQLGLRTDPLLDEEAVRVRMGLHSGDVQLVDGDYLGLTVHHAARVAGAAHGGQVLVSGATRALGDLGGEVEFLALGAHALKDLARPVELYQLVHDDLARDFPPIRSLSRGASNLPRPRTSLVGRDADVAALADHIRRPGLVTLTGPGGCGKTRLAIAAAAEMQDDAPGGVFFVDLRPAQNGAHVAEALAAAVGVDDPAGDGDPRVAAERAATRLGGQRTMVVLDNCEHVVAAAADVVDSLLAACPDLTVLATSRDLLGLDDEVARRVSSLAVPDERAEIDDPMAFAALVLFDERARRADPGFELAAHAATVARICRRVDGMPLAIELAAARLRHMSISTLEQQLSDMFRVLVGSDRRAVQRHQALEAVVGWSFDLLEKDDRQLLDELSVFLGAFSIADAQAVCTTDGAAEALFGLVDRSLVDAVGDDRYRLLETIRVFAERELQQSGDAAAVRDRHLRHIVAAVERMGEGVRGSSCFEAIEEMEPLGDDLRAALAWAIESGQFDAASRLIADASVFWHLTGRWNDATLAREHVDRGDGDALLAARATAGYAWALSLAGDDAEALADLAQQRFASVPGGADDEWYGLALVAAALRAGLAGDPAEAFERVAAAEAWFAGREGWSIAFVIAARAWANMLSDELAQCRLLLDDALAAARASANGLAIGACLFWCGLSSVHDNDMAAARAFYEEGLLYYGRLRHKVWLQWELDHLGIVCLSLDDLTAARAYAEEGVAVSRASGLARRGNYYSLLNTLSSIELYSGRLDQSALYLRESVELAGASEAHFSVPLVAALGSLELDLGNRAAAEHHIRAAFETVVALQPIRAGHGAMVNPPVWAVLAQVGYFVGLTGDPESGLALRAAAERLREEANESETTRRAEVSERRTKAVRDLLDPAAADAAWERGRALTDPIALARAALAESGVTPSL